MIKLMKIDIKRNLKKKITINNNNSKNSLSNKLKNLHSQINLENSLIVQKMAIVNLKNNKFQNQEAQIV